MIKKELLLASWLEKLQKKWDNEEYYYDVEEANPALGVFRKLEDLANYAKRIRLNIKKDASG